jgi:uncharacterized protein with FMN-binding domain
MRAPWVLGATIAGVAGIIVFHPHSSASSVTFNAPGTRAVGGTSTKAGGALSGGPPAAGSAPESTTTTAAGGAVPDPGMTTPSTQPTPTPTAPTPTTTAPAPTGTSGTVSGSVTQYPYGELQVTATVSGGRITNISTQVQSNDPRSQQIDNESLPMLRSQALSAQSANIQGVSGATYTSQAFANSLQSALRTLGFNG